MRVRIVAWLVLGALLGSLPAAANPPGFTLSLTGPTTVDRNVPSMYSGFLKVLGVDQPFVQVRIYVDGTTAGVVQTDSHGYYQIPISFSAPPFNHTVAAVAYESIPSLRTTSPTLNVAVTPVMSSIVVSPAAATIVDGATLQLNATALYDNGTSASVTPTAMWSSSSSGVATVGSGASAGLVTGVAPGTTSVHASVGPLFGSALVTVKSLTSISVTPSSPKIIRGQARQLTAVGHYTDGSTANLTSVAAWSSGNPAIATVQDAGSKGLASGVNIGATSISASFQGLAGDASVVVVGVRSIAITPASPKIVVGDTKAFTATASLSDGSTADVTASASWVSSSPATATVSPGGVASGLAAGVTSISATLDGITGATTLTVVSVRSLTISPANPAIPLGTTLQLTATALFSDGSSADVTTLASWSSTNSGVAPVSNGGATKGLVEGRAVGSAYITAVYKGVSATTRVNVIAPG